MCLSRSSLSKGSGPPPPPLPAAASCTEIELGGADADGDWTAAGALLATAAPEWPLDLMATKRGFDAMARRMKDFVQGTRKWLTSGRFHPRTSCIL